MSQDITSTPQNDLDAILLGICIPADFASPFGVLSDDELSEITNLTYHQKKPQIYRKRHTTHSRNACSCGGTITQDQSEAICDLCGITDHVDEPDASSIGMSNYNTSSDSANPLRVIGPGGMAFQRKLICKTSDYDKTRLRDTLQQMSLAADSYKQVAIPTAVVKEAGMRYYELQRVCEIKRGDVRRGAMATCLRLICDRHGLHKKRNVFAEMFQITLGDLSEGEKLLDRLFSDGKLNRDDFLVKNQETSRIQGYLIQYFILLGIPIPPELYQAAAGSDAKSKVPYSETRQYYEFVKRLIDFTFHFRLAESSVLYSKCVGAIWVLAARCPELGINQDQLAAECKISKSTFKRFSTIIEELLVSRNPKELRLQKKLKHLLHKYNI